MQIQSHFLCDTCAIRTSSTQYIGYTFLGSSTRKFAHTTCSATILLGEFTARWNYLCIVGIAWSVCAYCAGGGMWRKANERFNPLYLIDLINGNIKYLHKNNKRFSGLSPPHSSFLHTQSNFAPPPTPVPSRSSTMLELWKNNNNNNYYNYNKVNRIFSKYHQINVTYCVSLLLFPIFRILEYYDELPWCNMVALVSYINVYM